MAYLDRMAVAFKILIFLLLMVAVQSKDDKKTKDPVKIERKEQLQEAGAIQTPIQSRHLSLDEDYPQEGGEDYANEVSRESYKGDKHLAGNQNLGDVSEEHSTDMHHDRGSHQEFSQGGANFNKHHKENVADNKELENVKQHDAGEKFGAEALKEHKLGKHKEKSKGHKLHGFKNTYHKEEYGDHKTFHDEFLDTDHHHNYDDHHEHRQLQGGKFSKGFKQEGKNKNFDAGDERHEWGKEGHDAADDGQYEAGGHSSKHHQGHKKHEGHHEASSHEGRQSHRKQKKGKAPSYEAEISHNAPQYYDHDSQPHSSPPHLHFGQQTYPSDNYHSVNGGHYHNDHDNHAHHEERSVPSIKKHPAGNIQSAYTKPINTKELERVSSYKEVNPVAPVPQHHSEAYNPVAPIPQRHSETYNPVAPVSQPHSEIYNPVAPVIQPHSETYNPVVSVPQPHNVNTLPHYKPVIPHREIPRRPIDRHFAPSPVIAKQHQFYHRWPEHTKQSFPSVENHPQNYFPLHSGIPEQRHHHYPSRDPPIEGNIHRKPHRDYLASHPYSKPYNWHDRERGQLKHHAIEQNQQGLVSSRFDAGEQKIPESYTRQHVAAPSQPHYMYNYRN